MALGCFLECESRQEWVSVAVSLVEGKADSIVNSYSGAYFLCSFDVCEHFGLDAEAVLKFNVLFELCPLFILVGDEKISALI